MIQKKEKMISKLKKQYNRWKNGGYLGGIKSIFKRIDLLEEVLKSSNIKNLTIIEVGSERDVGSTYHFAKLADKHKIGFTTIDPDQDSFDSAKKITNQHKSEVIKAVNMTGEDFLEKYNENNILLAYLDGFDVVFPDSNHSQKRIDIYKKWGVDLLKDGNRISDEIHLKTTQFVFEKVIPNGFIVFDDTYLDENGWFGKGKSSIPFLLENGYKIINSTERAKNHSIILQRIS